jgi:hypothetical protein
VADRLTKASLQLPPCRKAYISISHLNGAVRKKALQQWEALWVREGDQMDRGARDTRLSQTYRVITQRAPNLTRKPTNLYSHPKQTLSAYIQLKTGIDSFRDYLTHIKKVSNRECFGECHTVQTAQHLVLHCPNYAMQYNTLRHTLRGLPLTMQVLFGTVKGRRALFTYLQQTEICIPRWVK